MQQILYIEAFEISMICHQLLPTPTALILEQLRELEYGPAQQDSTLDVGVLVGSDYQTTAVSHRLTRLGEKLRAVDKSSDGRSEARHRRPRA